MSSNNHLSGHVLVDEDNELTVDCFSGFGDPDDTLLPFPWGHSEDFPLDLTLACPSENPEMSFSLPNYPDADHEVLSHPPPLDVLDQ